MEIHTNSSWKMLCTSTWNKVEVDLTCMAMGYSNSSDYGRWYEDSGNVSETSTNFNCTTTLTKCEESFSNKLQFCKVPVRLSGANVEYGGRVEVFYKGKWGKICTNGWDLNDAQVICRQLGFEEALAEFFGSNVEDGNTTSVMADVSCTGAEDELASCTRSDGKLNVPGQCQGDGKGSQARCQPKNRKVCGKEKLHFDVGNNEILHCSIRNKTRFARWFINGQKVQRNTSSSKRVKTKGDGELVIENVQLSDGGTYECLIEEYVQYYTVYINARFTENTRDQQSLIAYTSGIINCSAEGTPLPQITWGKQGEKLVPNGRRFAQIPSGSLHIDLVHPEDGGTYRCTITQSKGSKRFTIKAKNISVSVIVRPQVNVSGASNLIREGDTVTLTCKIIQGRPQPQITWLKNNSFKGHNMSLSFNKITKEDAGLYTCEAKNRGGISAENIYISVKVPPHLNPELKNLSVPLNSTFETDCFKRADPPVSVNWTKDGKSLGNNNTLVIKRVTFDDEGLYECAAKNPFGKDKTSFWIDVTVSPQILLSPINQSVTDGDPVNFTCRATGVPTPKLTWTFNGGKLPFGINQNNYEGDSFLESFLEMQKITKEMEGTYKCTAENKANRISYSITLQVFEKPTAKVSPEPYPTLIQGDKLRLTCSVNEATVNITWRKDGDPIKERAVIYTQLDETTSYLVVEKVVEEDSGEYSCEARNRLGNVARSIVMIKVNPVSPFLEWYYIFGSMAALIVILLMCCYFWKRRRTAAAMALEVEFSPNQGEAVEMELVNVEVDEWEIEGNRVLLQEVIGRGAFGAVWRALLIPPNGRPGNRTVAAKCFTPTAGEEGRKCLMREIELGKILGKSNHPNIVKFIGCVTRQVHPILIMEHLPCGDLLGYMRKCRGINDRYYLGEGRPQVLNNYDLVLFAKQIAAGMVFLGSRGIIHRDLAARNVLLDNNYVCKVTDFGMAYQNFKYGHGKAKKGRLPIKWTAPEILLGNLAGLSILSDVWSYGIVLYEIVTLGGIPYEGWTEGKVVAQVTHGYKLPKPDHVDDKLYAIMKRCWNFDPDFRPPFENLRKRMDTYLREETYLHLLDMGSYDTIKYSKVEDLGDEDAEPSVRATRNAAAKRLGKWASDRR
ncbi:vascular endothelial growth factor receptor 3-like isoform X5 [Pocillopora damicornis]|uniref:vascular endothelial growth factor receptor 3-like isoform X5 n=1 Tax=Pocillopora damicornis TaxID=46731 RepID=UPI000F553963|nr:vascular endothelial growth factor receptor 3-like isoform X5 [Pocillopora damicornis]